MVSGTISPAPAVCPHRVFQIRKWFLTPFLPLLTRPATAGESAVAGHPLPKGEGCSLTGRGLFIHFGPLVSTGTYWTNFHLWEMGYCCQPSEALAGTTGLEPATSCVTGEHRMANSLTLRHGWQPKSTQKHAQDAQVVPILYSP